MELGFGFTDMCKSTSGMDHQIPVGEFDRVSFEAKIRRHRPRVVAFTSKKAASVWLGLPTGKIALGRQDQREALPVTFVLPSPSGAATRYWDEQPWHDLAAVVRQS
jgi:TDG/mug DNA glycosylase family protein